MTTIKFRRDTSANWTSVNPIPAQGEPCYETDTGKLKIGNGSDNYTSLPYVSDGGGSGGTTDYVQLENKPQINSVELSGNKTLDDLGIQAKGDYQPAGDYATTADIPTKTSELTNDSGFLTEVPVPDNMVTTDTTQTISGTKIFSTVATFNNGCNFTGSYGNNYFKKGFRIGNIDVYNSSGDIIRIGASSTRFTTIYNNTITLMSSSSTPGMSITDGVITAGYNKPYLKIKEYNDNSNTHNLEINCDTANDNIWSITSGEQTFINTANIDTTYMKMSDGKLSVDTAAVAHLAMPSSTSVSLTLGASGATYTAPADGYISLSATSGYTGWIKVDTRPGCYGYANSSQFLCNSPIIKDTSFKVWYSFSSGNASALQYTFIYCNGTTP